MIILFYKRIDAWGGAEKFLLEEFTALKEKGYEVKIVSFNIKNKIFNNQFKDIRSEIINFRSSYLFGLISLFLYFFKHRPKHVITSFGHIEIFLIHIFLKIPYWIHVHHPSFMTVNDTDIYHFRNKKVYLELIKKFPSGKIIEENKKKMNFFTILFFRLRSILSINSLKKAKGLFVLSEYHKYEKAKLYGLKSYVLCGAFSNKQFESPRKMSIGMPKKAIHLLSVCRLDPNKRVSSAIDAMELIKEKNYNFRLDIIGTGQQENFLKEYAQIKNLNNIYFHGFVQEKDLQKFYEKADIFLALDIGDFKLNMHEALLNHIPCVVSEETEISNNLKKTNYAIKSGIGSLNLSNSILKMFKRIKYEKNIFDDIELENYLNNLKWNNYYTKLLKIINGVDQ